MKSRNTTYNNHITGVILPPPISLSNIETSSFPKKLSTTTLYPATFGSGLLWQGFLCP